MRFLLFLLLICATLAADVTVDLREPRLEDGVLRTTLGGVITGPRFRLQAQNIAYTKKKDSHKVEASGYVMVDFGDYIFVGESLEYDFTEQTGQIVRGNSRKEPWYFGGETIELFKDGSYIISNAYLTTSESDDPDWKIHADQVKINKSHTIDLSGVKFRLFNIPGIWIPSFKFNISTISQAPLRFYTRWGGKQGTRIGAKYSLIDFECFKTYLRLDWRLKRGLGGGIETYYCSEDRKHSLETINYYAHDNSLEDLEEKIRYRFQGIYHNKLYNDRVSVFASWDKLSDRDMSTDYNDNGLKLNTAERTELLFRKQDVWWITNFATRLRVNQFQTVKQELPSLLFNQRPWTVGNTGIILENKFEGSYLDFTYANDVRHVSDYNSPRLMQDFRLLRPFHGKGLNMTPKAGFTTMTYGNSPARNAKFLLMGYAGLNINTSMYYTVGDFKHVLYPYFDWQHLSAPTVNPDDHYIFDIEDGLWRINAFRVGVRQDLLSKNQRGITRLFETDLFTYLFVDSAPIPKFYGRVTWRAHRAIRQSIETAWDFNVNELDHFNFRNDWTIDKDCAVSCEWRHRSRYSWRKAVWNNFNLESFRSTRSLLDSSVSDRRDTLLCRFFWRIHPLFAVNFESRQGWNRRREPGYNEFEIDFLCKLRSHWNIKLSVARTEADSRVGIYFALDLGRPSKDSSCLLRTIEF